MATPRVKRPFAGSSSDPSQRQITSFFDRSNDVDSPSDSRPSIERRSSTPLLPPGVQANLLAVGMRVRKSVPEGYKTGKEELMESSPVVGPRRAAQTTYTAPVAAPPAPSYNNTFTARQVPVQRELTPFCGLHKIGGLGVQSFGDDDGRPMFAASLFDGSADLDGGNDDSEPPSLTSSQETVSSMTSYYSPPSSQSRFSSASSRFNNSFNAASASTRKRFFGQEEDAQTDASNSNSLFQVHEDARLPASASSSSSINRWLTDGNVGVGKSSMAPPQGRRVLAIPRRRGKSGEQLPPLKQQGDGQQSVRFLDQENVEIAGDFDEADFLDASMLAEGNGEHDMEMGGM
ncbi:hypothetical protein Sste5346_007474 [Sporothrix stenoceras]|uniref:Uncharacterized protein n=1 Tax=Sporothrix stenoceras TaxID=5173 RepID=A0ABR3YWM7_9PEZI